MADDELLHIARNCTFFHLKRMVRAVTRVFDEALAPAGLTAGQFNTLVLVAIPGRLTLGQIAERMVMDRTTVTRTLAPLVKSGHLAIEVSPTDRRARVVSLTAKGRRALAAGRRRWEQAQARVIARLGHEKWQALMQHLYAAERVVD